LSLPDEGPFDLYGDILTEDISSVLAELADESIIDQLIDDRSLNEYVRWEAAQTFLYFVRDGRMTREAAVESLRAHLATAIALDDIEGVLPPLMELAHLWPREAMAEIREAFDRGMVEDFSITLEEFRVINARGEAGFQRSLAQCDPTGIADAVESLHSWFDNTSDFTPTDDERDWQLLKEELGIAAHMDESYSPRAIVRAETKVGRNDPCPCGSGKKHKKCCGRAQ
jgi:hypothetical protein